MAFRYETHLHSAPVSACARATVEESLNFYKSIGYDGVFLTNHFIDGNVRYDHSAPYEEMLEFYLSDYYDALKIGQEIGIKVFFGVELSMAFHPERNVWGGTDFLVYGLEPDWYRAHPGIMEMLKQDEMTFMMEEGALVSHAHPFREARYIDYIRLFPRAVNAVEIINASRTEFENSQAEKYAADYDLLQTAGSDNHTAGNQPRLAGMETDEPIESVADFVRLVKERKTRIFTLTKDADY